ncbi:MAG: M20/M25/M40 family metallo-hydrolase, partial [Pseudomonadota bacterium]
MDQQKNFEFVNALWEDSVLSSLAEYVEIPCKSPMFDPDWAQHGYMEDAVEHVISWVREQDVAGLDIEVHRLPEKTPTILLTYPGDTKENVLIYGHLDKQPEFSGWEEGLAPFKAVFRDDKLYGRGGGDDGYAIYSAVTAIKSLIEQEIPLPRIVILIEASEESGSPDLLAYMDHLEDIIGEPGLVIALDSTCGNYDQLWVNTSLRGMIIADLTVRVLTEGIHSGMAGGMVPSSFRLLRQLISRLEDETTGEILPDFLNDQVPQFRWDEAMAAGQVLGDSLKEMFPLTETGRLMSDDPTELILANTWAASLAVTGLAGAPAPEEAGNVLRPETTARLALRLPPTINEETAARKLTELLSETAPSFGRQVGRATRRVFATRSERGSRRP